MTLSAMAVAPSHADEAPLLAEGLFERHASALRGFCAQRTASRADAEEAVQATFLRALRAMRQGVRPRSERAWLLTIARNVCATQATSAHRRREVAFDPSVLELGAEDPALDGIVDPELVTALEALPDGQRRAFVLRAVEGLSYREIAGELGVTEAAVETWIFRARRKLAAAVGESRRRLASLSSLFGAAKSLLGGSAALKAAAAASVVVATGVSVAPVVRDRAQTPAPPQVSVPAQRVTPTPEPRRVAPRMSPVRDSRRVEQRQPPSRTKDTAPPAAENAHTPPALAPPPSVATVPTETHTPSPTVPPAPVQEVTDTANKILDPARDAVDEIVPPVVPVPDLPPVPALSEPTDVLPVELPEVQVPPLLP